MQSSPSASISAQIDALHMCRSALVRPRDRVHSQRVLDACRQLDILKPAADAKAPRNVGLKTGPFRAAMAVALLAKARLAETWAPPASTQPDRTTLQRGMAVRIPWFHWPTDIQPQAPLLAVLLGPEEKGSRRIIGWRRASALG